MSDNNSNNAPYYGKAMPANPKNIMEDNNDTTRHVPRMVKPSMGAMPLLSGSGTMKAPAGISAQISTAAMKAPMLMKRSASRPVFVWMLTKVPSLPAFHPLERTSVFCPNTSPRTIAHRISHVLRERSIEASYDDEKAKVRCMTGDGVDFRIRFYQGRGDEYSHGIIVEIQRRFGSSLQFHSDTQAILDAAQGKQPTMTAVPPFSMTAALPEVSDDEEDEGDAAAAAPPPSGSSSLAMVSKMMSLSGFDAQYLGLQTLSSLVDSDRMSLQTARAVATSLLQEDSEVGGKVASYILNRSNAQEDESQFTLRFMSLTILADAMRASGITPEFLRSDLRRVLLQDLKHAQQHPNLAFVAAQSMEFFIRGDDDTTELNDVFEMALAEGEARHSKLMHQAERCIAAIQ